MPYSRMPIAVHYRLQGSLAILLYAETTTYKDSRCQRCTVPHANFGSPSQHGFVMQLSVSALFRDEALRINMVYMMRRRKKHERIQSYFANHAEYSTTEFSSHAIRTVLLYFIMAILTKVVSHDDTQHTEYLSLPNSRLECNEYL